MKCKKCGGNRTQEKCNLCDLFEHGYTLDGMRSDCWPMTSKLSYSCDPSQIPEMMARNKEHGIAGVSYTPEGHCVIAGPKAYKDLLKLEGHYNKDSFYGY